MIALYHTDQEFLQHSKAIHSIADQYHLKETLIREIYEKQLKQLQITAKFKNYLSVLVTRHVKEALHKSGLIKTSD